MRPCIIAVGFGIACFFCRNRQPDIKACPRIDKFAQGGRLGRVQQELFGRGFAGPPEANQILLDPPVDSTQRQTQFGNIILCGVMARAQPVKLRHAALHGQDLTIHTDGFQFRG